MSVVVPSWVARTYTSVSGLVSGALPPSGLCDAAILSNGSNGSSVVNATYRPSAEIAGSLLSYSAWAPDVLTETRCVPVPVSAAAESLANVRLIPTAATARVAASPPASIIR